MRNYLDIIYENKHYIQRNEFSKIIEYDEDYNIIKRYNVIEELKSNIQDEINNILDMQLHPEDYFDYEEFSDDVHLLKFYNNKNIKNIVIPETIKGKKISGLENIFAYTEIQQLVLPNTICQLPEELCISCTSLQEVYLPNSIKFIPDMAFQDCIKLKKINLENITKIGHHSFFSCFSINYINCEKLMEIDTDAFNTCHNLLEANLPQIKKIGCFAFENCISLEKVHLSEKLLRIEKGAFMSCEKLKDIKIPKNVKYIDKQAFKY